MAKRKTDAEFKKDVYDLVGDEYIFLDSYVTAKTKIRVKHNECGNVYKVTPSNFLRGSRCPVCSLKVEGKARRKTNIQFKKEVLGLVGNDYVFLDPYVNARTKIRVKHNKCGNTYKVLPSKFLNGRRCPYCFGKHKKTDAEFKQEVYNLVGNEYTFLDNYANNHTKVRVKHNKCNNIYDIKPNDFLMGHRCPYCAGYIKKTNSQFKQEVFSLVGGEYTFLDEYVTNKIKLRVKHNKCGKVYEVTPSDFLQGYRCPYCNSPKGETTINKILDTLNIHYEAQKTFDGLRDTQPLSYDFYIPTQSILIEYQGIQHYQPIDFFGGTSAFKKQQKHDKLKSDYANDHGYTLIVVPYTVDTFSKIKKYLSNHGLKLH